MAEIDLYLLDAYQYDLPEELIAHYPCQPRDCSRLMVVDRKLGSIKEMVFKELVDLLQAGDGLVFNDTRVIPARLIGARRTGGKTEVFLNQRHPDGTWDALVRPGRKMPPGTFVDFNENLSCEVLDVRTDGQRHIRFHCKGELDQVLQETGQIPLPQYIRRESNQDDKTNYQTVYAANPGALAAPTAGLHFTEELLEVLTLKGISQTKVTLHTGLGTFLPARTKDIRQHDMHTENYVITPEAAAELNHSHCSGHRQICVGTTSCRALESISTPEGVIFPGNYQTNIFIYPGYKFKYVKSLLTNFHLPGSTLLMLISAFGGYELIREAYAKAIKDKYRFFSYGDAMLIL